MRKSKMHVTKGTKHNSCQYWNKVEGMFLGEQVQGMSLWERSIRHVTVGAKQGHVTMDTNYEACDYGNKA